MTSLRSSFGVEIRTLDYSCLVCGGGVWLAESVLVYPGLRLMGRSPGVRMSPVLYVKGVPGFLMKIFVWVLEWILFLQSPSVETDKVSYVPLVLPRPNVPLSVNYSLMINFCFGDSFVELVFFYTQKKQQKKKLSVERHHDGRFYHPPLRRSIFPRLYVNPLFLLRQGRR